MIKAIIRFFLSMKTAFGLFLSFVVIAFIGSFVLPRNLAFFSGIDESPLFKWLSENSDLSITWWIYALISMLTVMALSTIFCTIEALLKRMSRKQFVLKISPQIMHIGVLFIMLGHLLTASAGFKEDVLINKGEKKTVAENKILSLEDVSVTTGEDGYDIDWQASIKWFDNGQMVKEGVLRPVHPVFAGQFGLYVESVTIEPEPSALIRVRKDPGALWALFGGFLLSLGGVGFAYARFRNK
ncbi:MAG: hypothetical protein V3V59_03670 [Thermodesulfovibrionales bacterium]